MQKLILATAVGASVLLTACSPSGPSEQETNSAVSNSLNADASNANQLLKELQRQDPSITDVHFKGDPSNKMIVIARKDVDGNIVTTEVPYNAAIPPGQSQTFASDSGSGMGSMLAAGAIGMMAGHLMSSALSPSRSSSNWSSPMSGSRYDDERERNRSSYTSAAANSYRSNYVSGLRSGTIQSKSAASSPSKGSTVGKSSGGSFKSSGTRAGGYSGGGSGG